MAATWNIVTLEHDLVANRATVAHWEARDGAGEFVGRSYGSVSIQEQAKNTPWENLTEAAVLGWVRDSLGEGEVGRIESSCAAQRAEKENPTKAQGVPWS